MNLPPLPPWEGAHPIIVHMPIGMLPLAGLLAFIAMLSVRSRRAWSGAALLSLALGAAGTIFAAMSGEATEHAVIIPASAERVFHDHEHLAGFTRNLFIAGAVLYAIIALSALLWAERVKRLAWIGAHVLFLALFAYAFLNLANTGHLGGLLVHEYGVRAPMAGAMDPAQRDPNIIADDDGDEPPARKKK